MSEVVQVSAFDTTKHFAIPIKSGGEKRFVVRWPSDEQWCRYSRAQVSVRRFLGRGKTISETRGVDDAAAELLTAIKVDGPEFDGPEAAAVIDKLQRASIENCAEEAGAFVVELRVAGGVVTKHALRAPSIAQVQRFQRDSTSTTTMRRSQEIRGFLEPGAALYGDLLKSVEGYAGAVPVVHQFAVIGEVVAAVADEDDGEAFPE